MFNIICVLIYFLKILTFGFILNYFLFQFILLGYFGVSLQGLLINKTIKNDYSWLTKILLYVYILYIIIIIISNNIIYLDTDVCFSISGLKYVISGEYIATLLKHGGSGLVFLAGARIGSAYALSKGYGLLPRVGLGASAGAALDFSFEPYTYGKSLLKAKLNITENQDVIKIDVTDAQIVNNNNVTIHLNNSNLEDLDNILSWIPKFKEDRMNLKTFSMDNYNSKFTNIKLVKTETKDSQIIQMIEQENTKKLSEIFNNENVIDSGDRIKNNLTNTNSNTNNNANIDIESNTNTDFIINSPLESGDLANFHNDIIQLLNYSLILNMFIIYFVLMLFLIFSMKVIIDNNISIDRVKSLPLGKYIHYFLEKYISIWKKNNVFWIYFIIIIMFISLLASTYGIYVSIFLLK